MRIVVLILGTIASELQAQTVNSLWDRSSSSHGQSGYQAAAHEPGRTAYHAVVTPYESVEESTEDSADYVEVSEISDAGGDDTVGLVDESGEESAEDSTDLAEVPEVAEGAEGDDTVGPVDEPPEKSLDSVGESIEPSNFDDDEYERTTDDQQLDFDSSISESGMLGLELGDSGIIAEEFNLTDSHSSEPFQPKCGCFFDFQFPDSVSTPITQILLPAVSIDAQVKVSANLASTKLIFKYENPSDKDINIQFKFPTDVNTAIYSIRY